MGLTILFKAYGVVIDGEPFRQLLHTDIYDERLLHRMAYNLHRGQWRWKIFRQTTNADKDAAEEERIYIDEARPSKPQRDIPYTQPEPSVSAHPEVPAPGDSTDERITRWRPRS